MSPLQIDLVRSSFSSVAPSADVVARRFYGRMFELDPSLRSMFKIDMEVQGNKVIAMIGTAVSLLEQPGQLVPILQSLGRRHAGYGVKDEHYQIVGAALIWALKQELRTAFTQDVEDAWVEVYSLLSETMRAAAVPLA